MVQSTFFVVVARAMELATSTFLGTQLRPAVLSPSHSPTAMFAGKPTGGMRFSAASAADYSRGKRGSDKMYTRLDSCLVIPPPRYKEPRAVVKFLGGAFVGAAPEVTYSYLKELLAKEGYVIISVPYNVTFDHERAAKQVYERFNSCLDMMLSSGIPNADLRPEDLADLPLFSVGHSNGALLQVLTGSYFSEKIPKLGPLVRQIIPLVEATPVYAMAQSASGDALKGLLETAAATILNNDQEAVTSLTKLVDQLPSVFGEVAQGVSEFRPKPPENRDFCKSSYNVQHTLLVKFKSDTIDESDLLEETLRPRVESYGGTLEKVLLGGNHLTPCIQDPRWQVGSVYTPADAIAQALKTLSLNDTRLLSRTIVDWFKQFEH
ncbi:PREDICTED: uncharacterized protein LOC104799597 isoform X2 [Tarenaya hassleriana]|uniref:uncharacterized protein LOC104799597 isoform X2 n=1 Tax=Tarenaya hassleriana TaxID=28532 RepID=UPI00053C7EA8|nr:PREDICTED: uncharacterized protein LOC104799597 isoform X2 [Tarenaya hassleriana]